MKNEADTFIRNVGNHPATLRYKPHRLGLSIIRLLKSQNLFNFILVHEVRATDRHVQKPLNNKINVRVCIKVSVIPHRKHSVVPLKGPIRECCILEIPAMCCVDHTERTTLCGEKYNLFCVLTHIAITRLKTSPFDDGMYHPEPSLVTTKSYVLTYCTII
jgi:hypothetical protein